MNTAFSLRTMAFGLLLLALIVAGRLVDYYHDNYLRALEKQTEYANLAQSSLDAIATMQRQQQEVASLDAKYTRELNNAKRENDRLRADVVAGHRRLRIQGTSGMPKATASSCVGDGASIELNRGVGQTVLDIRAGMINDQQKLRFLQAYVKTQCH